MHFSIFSKYLLITVSLPALTACTMSQDLNQPAYTERQLQQPLPGSLSADITESKTVKPGVQLGLYLTPKKASHQVLALKRDYPAALNGLEFRFKQREQKGVTLYGLRAGPFANYTQATAFCEIAKKMDQTCVTAPFVGQML